MSKTVIIGGVAGGATAAARLRRRDESMEIVMLENIFPLPTAAFPIISGTSFTAGSPCCCRRRRG